MSELSELVDPVMLPSIGGGEIALHHLGGTGPSVMFVHATGFNAHTYGPFTEHLSKEYSIWAPDLRAHGWSTAPTNGDYEWTSLAEDLLTVVDYLEIRTGELDCVGHSVGAATLLLADSIRPGLIRSMYGYEPIMWRPGECFAKGENPLVAGAQKRRQIFDSRAQALERFASKGPFRVCRADALKSYVDFGFEMLPNKSIQLRCSGMHESAVYDGERVSTTDRILNCLAPVVIGKGADEGFGNLGTPAFEALPNASLKIHADLGHFGPLEAPNRIADDAIASLWSPS
jgi:pimeloyl-ACP methyl ester carboxylesterase